VNGTFGAAIDRREEADMGDFFLSPAFVTMLLLFYWVPFAVGAYFADHYKPERTREWLHKHRRPTRHIGHGRHAPTAA
jgi:hypothetical protein